MDGAHLMSSYSICSFILIAWRLAPGLIYCILLTNGSKDRIIHFLLNRAVVLLTISKHITNLNESSQYPRKSRVSCPSFIGRDLQHCHLSSVLAYIWIVFSSIPPSFQERTFFFPRWAKESSPHILFVECCGWKLTQNKTNKKNSTTWGSNSTQKMLVSPAVISSVKTQCYLHKTHHSQLCKLWPDFPVIFMYVLYVCM